MPMNTSIRCTLLLATATVAAASLLAVRVTAAEGHDSATKQFMKQYHKAPKGVDPVCKKAVDGKATPEEIKRLVAGYRQMVAAKPPKGDAASWTEKTTKLLAAAEELQKGAPDAAAHYKEAVNCKACHSVHKGE